MPRAPKRCAKCPALVAGGTTYCATHQPVGWHTNPSPRNTRHTRQELRAFRDAVLARDPWCRKCGARRSEHADHIVPIADGGTNNPDTNGQGLCEPCHKTKTKTEHRQRGRGTPRPPVP